MSTIDTQAAQVSGYVAARHEWDERYGGLVAKARNWMMVALITGATALLAVIGLLWSASRSHVVPFVVMVDHMGRPVASGLADEASGNDERLNKAALYAWLEAARTVTPDTDQQKKLIASVYSHIANGTQARIYIGDFYRADSPYDRARTESVAVQVNDVLANTDHTYQVDWAETTRDTYGAVKTTEHWKASITFVTIPPTKQEQILVNPLGLYVVNVNWTKILQEIKEKS